MTSAGNRLVESRVVTDLTPVLTKLFEDELTGQLVVEPADSLVLESEQGCEITLVEGIPRAARGGRLRSCWQYSTRISRDTGSIPH